MLLGEKNHRRNPCNDKDVLLVRSKNVSSSNSVSGNDGWTTGFDITSNADEHQLLMSVANTYKGSEYPFPVKLHYMLHDAEKKGFHDVVSWLPDGRGFIIQKPKEAAKGILHKWFRQRCYGSFQRQLNLYNFTRSKCGSTKGAYYHDLFIKGKPALSYGIKRVPIKNTGQRNRATSKIHNTMASGSLNSIEKTKARTITSSMLLTKFPAASFTAANESTVKSTTPTWWSSSTKEQTQIEATNEMLSQSQATPCANYSLGSKTGNMLPLPDTVKSQAMVILDMKGCASGRTEHHQQQHEDDRNNGAATATTSLLEATRAKGVMAKGKITSTCASSAFATAAMTSSMSFPKLPSSLSLCAFDSNTSFEEELVFPTQKNQGQNWQCAENNCNEILPTSYSFRVLANLLSEMDQEVHVDVNVDDGIFTDN